MLTARRRPRSGCADRCRSGARCLRRACSRQRHSPACATTRRAGPIHPRALATVRACGRAPDEAVRAQRSAEVLSRSTSSTAGRSGAEPMRTWRSIGRIASVLARQATYAGGERVWWRHDLVLGRGRPGHRRLVGGSGVVPFTVLAPMPTSPPSTCADLARGRRRRLGGPPSSCSATRPGADQEMERLRRRDRRHPHDADDRGGASGGGLMVRSSRDTTDEEGAHRPRAWPPFRGAGRGVRVGLPVYTWSPAAQERRSTSPCHSVVVAASRSPSRWRPLPHVASVAP